MKGDFSRNTFNASKHFSRVLLQQGRVQLDADGNEQAAILLHYLQTLAADLLGPHAGPGDDFQIVGVDAKGNPFKNDFAIRAGHYYVDGILCENEPQSLDDSGKPIPVTYYTQPDLPFADDNRTLPQGQSLVYLDVWERYISHLADDSIRETALDGPDTAGRAKVVWQVKLLQPQDDGVAVSCADVARLLPTNQPRLRARIRPEQPSTDPCIVAPDSNYRGAENRLYRVEIHTGSNPTAGANERVTFKWARDNGAIATAWLRNEGDAAIVTNPRGFAAGQWVELTDDVRDLHGQPGMLSQIVKVEGEALTLSPVVAWNKNFKNPVVRRWDQIATTALPLSSEDNAVPLTEESDPEKWIDLEDGVQIQFQPPSVAKTLNQYRTGDYWLIPARTATGAIEWPVEVDNRGEIKLDQNNRPIPAALKPQGIVHHYAPLAVISVAAGEVTVQSPDCRCQITPVRKCP